ncbi:efflux RND transporter periplasmic adaptor subunit [Hephaestia mangrovi]|uniref:efflux RND transporter periplasmic adaptor subunit n=1 Tax=Hephaestia mangrovi TaxID=2873268 RepID=UPI001CA6A9FD|nr:efflux RND transporter periplasmic adaptor subunit [Hephaestia mangrovi]MBY8828348.1 efflux RND transporter periplasmic adaptor subunit [Hephaestia mangrovi]
MTDATQDDIRHDAEAETIAEEAVQPPQASPPVERGNPRARRKWLAILAAIVVIAIIVYAVWHLFFAAPSETTDDAYVAGDTVTITARDPGTVTALYADDTERVRAGQPLVDLDPATADVDLAAAAAQLGQAVRGVRGDFSAVSAANAEVANARADLARARNDLARRQQAAGQGAVSGEEVSHAADTVKTATAALNLAESKLAQAQTQVQGADVRSNPAVLAAIAAYRRAAIRRSHMHIVAPVDGTIAQRTVQIGQQIAAGTPLMAVVPLHRVWIDANFRETQLADLRVGQPATITTDTYGGKVVYHGHVVGLGAGSGNAFALLPPQNASGNWIKIVQRVPVRVALDANELDKHPLRIGLSVDVDVDTSNTSGSLLGREAHQAFATQASDSPDVDADIARIIAANAGRGR